MNPTDHAQDFFVKLKGVLRDTRVQTKEAHLIMVASSLAYTTILSIIPALAVSFSIFKAFGGMDKLLATIQPFILENLAEGASDEVMATISGFINNIHAGAIGVGGLLGLIFTTMSMLFNIEKSINRIWKAPMEKTLFQRFAQYWFFITLGPLGLSVIVGAATTAASSGGAGAVIRFLPGFTGILFISAIALSAIYKWVPNRKVHWAPALISGSVTAVAWNIARWGYAVYTQRSVSYNKIYGSLAAIPLLLLWIYIVWVIVLTGAALTAALQKRYDFE